MSRKKTKNPNDSSKHDNNLINYTFERNIGDVVETLQNFKANNLKGAFVLLGAGCSVSAGIPSASEITEIIKIKYPEAFKRAKIKNYLECMAELSRKQRHDLIGNVISDKISSSNFEINGLFPGESLINQLSSANEVSTPSNLRINWAHIAIAQLIKNGFIDRVYTTNFDPLIVRACSLVGVFPAVYDLTESRHYKSSFLHTPSVLYLHGQYTGFSKVITQKECLDQSSHLDPVFGDALNEDRPWLVAGYSGESDPVFERLAGVESFDSNLFWVCHLKSLPGNHVFDNIIKKDKCAYYVTGYDADSFFIKLAYKLDSFPPIFF